MIEKTGNITLGTLAARLGVSVATISKALSGKGRIGEEMRLKIKQLADELGYVPDAMARSLQKKVNDAVGFAIMGDIGNPWYSRVVSSISEHLDELGNTMMLAVGKDNPERFRHILASFVGSRVQGIIAGPVTDERSLEVFRPAIIRNIPLVVFGNLQTVSNNFVTPDQEWGGVLAADYLVELGHKRIAFMGANEESAGIPGTRFYGFVTRLNHYGLMPDFIVYSPLFSTRHGAYQLACEKLVPLPREQRPTAIFCHNDDLALGLVLALQQHGIRVPEDISVIGFDDIDEAAFAFPKLTTIGGLKEVYPAELCEALQLAVQHPQDIVVQRFIKPKLIIRNSTCCPADLSLKP